MSAWQILDITTVFVNNIVFDIDTVTILSHYIVMIILMFNHHLCDEMTHMSFVQKYIGNSTLQRQQQ